MSIRFLTDGLPYFPPRILCSCFFNDVGIAVFTHNWQWLYDHYVHLTKEKKTLKEMTKEFKLRLKPINRSNRAVSVDEKGKIKAQ